MYTNYISRDKSPAPIQTISHIPRVPSLRNIDNVPAFWQVGTASRSLRVTVPQIQAHLSGFLLWSRGPCAHAAGGSLHVGAILKALSTGGVSGSLPTGSLLSSYRRVTLCKLCSLEVLIVLKSPQNTKHNNIQSMPSKLQKPSINNPLAQ